MALPSQTSRAETWRSSGSSGPSSSLTGMISQNKPLFIGGIAAAVAIGGFFYYRSHAASPSTVAAAPTGDTFIPSGQSPQTAVKPLGEQPPTPVAPKPMTLSMGGLNDSPTASPKASASSSLDDLLAQSGSKGAAQPTTTPPPTPPLPTRRQRTRPARPPSAASRATRRHRRQSRPTR